MFFFVIFLEISEKLNFPVIFWRKKNNKTSLYKSEISYLIDSYKKKVEWYEQIRNEISNRDLIHSSIEQMYKKLKGRVIQNISYVKNEVADNLYHQKNQDTDLNGIFEENNYNLSFIE